MAVLANSIPRQAPRRIDTDGARRYRVLIVDDEKPILVAIREYLSALGFLVDAATELEEALALLSNVPYDLLIADLRLTGFGGSEGLEILGYARSRRPEIRSIILSAYGSPEVELEARRRGVDRFLHKPSPLSDLAWAAIELLGIAQA